MPDITSTPRIFFILETRISRSLSSWKGVVSSARGSNILNVVAARL